MKPVKIYAEHLEQTALDQFNSAMEQDYSVKGALMPDAHTGYSMPIGGVVATDGVVVPAWVGYDIGCGMCAVKTDMSPEILADKQTQIFRRIYESVPVGFKMHPRQQESALMPHDLTLIGQKAFQKRGQFHGLGTLGGGNHFIEIGLDENQFVWIIVHSGSRGVGHGIATEYMRLASGDGKVREGHYGLRVDTDDGLDYINDLNWALAFALENRQQIIRSVVSVLHEFDKCDIHWADLINRNHNHAEQKDGLWIHRKGATHAEAGMMGVIPGNMRDGSFIVRGLGNPESLWSSSHGAGRVLGRKQAKRVLDMSDFEREMAAVTAKVCSDTLDESPMAYKNIFEVMDLQKDLVEAVAHVKPVINVKG